MVMSVVVGREDVVPDVCRSSEDAGGVFWDRILVEPHPDVVGTVVSEDVSECCVVGELS